MDFNQMSQLGWTNSQVGVLPTTLDNVNPAYYGLIADFISGAIQRNPGASLKSFYGARWYDTLRVDAGTMPVKETKFFSQAVGGQGKLFIANTAYTKDYNDTNMQINGMFANGYESLIWSIQVEVSLVQALDKTLQTTGNAVGLPLNPGLASTQAATDVISQANLMRAFQTGSYFEFKINNTGFENGRADHFPSAYGVGGGGITMAGVVAGPIGDGAIPNSLGGFSYQIPILRHLPPQTQFQVSYKNLNPFTNTAPFQVTVILEGIGIQPVTG